MKRFADLFGPMGTHSSRQASANPEPSQLERDGVPVISLSFFDRCLYVFVSLQGPLASSALGVTSSGAVETQYVKTAPN
jgi:hypothetical protein